MQMTQKVSRLFTPEDLERIKSSVQAAEGKTSGEIVPYMVDRSDDYEESEWRLGSLLTLLVLGGSSAFHHLSESWLPLDAALLVLASASAFLVGFALAKYAPPVKRFFAGRTLIDRRVNARAAEAFLAEEVFRTRDRTGILIFVSLLERRVLVLGDSGINAKVEKADWQDIVDLVTRSIGRGKPADALMDAIAKAGDLLARSDVRRRPDDTDELPDDLRIGTP
jgi:putative membrane protein